MARQNGTIMSWSATLLALPPIAILFLSDVISYAFAWHSEIASLQLVPVAARADATGRLLMLATALVGFGVAYLIVLRFIADLRDEFDWPTRIWLLGWYGGGVTLGAIWVVLGLQQVAASDKLGVGFMKEVLEHLDPTGGPATLAAFGTLVVASRFAFMLAAGIVVTGGVSALVEQRGASSDEAAEWAFLVHQRHRLRVYVNAAAALLVASVLFQVAWMRWPLVAFEPDAARALGAQIDAFALYTGVAGSVVIALFAIPVSSILAGRAAALPRPADAPPAPVLIDASLLQSIGKVLVILAPTLAGTLPVFLDFAGKLVTAI